MTIEVLGMVSTSYGSESVGWHGPVVDVDYLTAFAQAHDQAGFDRILVAHGASSPDGFAVAAHCLYNTERAGVLIAHRPGFVAPTQTARKLATLEHLTGEGRVAIHHITGGSDTDQARDGDFIDKEARYRRTAEFIDVLRRTFTATEPFDHDGEFYRFEGAVSSVRPLHEGSIPIFFGGQSDAAVRVGSEHADVYALWGEPLADTAQRIAVIREQAARHGRQVEFSLSTRPIIAETEDEAWDRAAGILDAAQALADAGGARRPGPNRHSGENAAVGAARLRAWAAEKDVHDDRLFFGVTRITGGAGNSTGHVGTPQQVVEALLEYYDLGITKFLIRGYDPLNDVREWGQELVPLLRKGAADRGAPTPSLSLSA
jgi:alkanesulfonate monooxygenase